MRTELIEVELKNTLKMPNGVALLLGNHLKSFIVYVDSVMGEQIRVVLQKGKVVERPLTHDFVYNMCVGFKIDLHCVVITDMKEGIYFARVILKQKLGEQTRVLELDVRPSDAILLALKLKKPLYVDANLLKTLQDGQAWLKTLEQ